MNIWALVKNQFTLVQPAFYSHCNFACMVVASPSEGGREYCSAHVGF